MWTTVFKRVQSLLFQLTRVWTWYKKVQMTLRRSGKVLKIARFAKWAVTATASRSSGGGDGVASLNRLPKPAHLCFLGRSSPKRGSFFYERKCQEIIELHFLVIVLNSKEFILACWVIARLNEVGVEFSLQPKWGIWEKQLTLIEG